MLRKLILTSALSLTLLAGGYAPATAQDLHDDPDTVVSVQAGGQTEMAGDWVDSKEVNTVQESPVARKMTQAEKNENAKENDSWGGAITIISMTVVIGALIILSLLFLGFGKISQMLLSNKKMKSKGVDRSTAEEEHRELESGEVIAAIAAALSEHFGTAHDMEDYKLTIRTLRKAYSPWNSKIYNLRHEPDVHRNPASGPLGKNS